MISKAVTEVDKLLSELSKENSSQLDKGLIIPFSEDYQFCTNGVYFYVGKMGSGKTYGAIRHVMITDRMMKQPYYDQLVVSATGDQLDETSRAFLEQCDAPIQKVDDVHLMDYLMKNVKEKSKFYAITEFINSGLTKITPVMNHILLKHRFQKQNGKFELRGLMAYVLTKLQKYPFKKYPSNTFLILDDYGGHKLLNKADSPLANFITKVRHYNYTVCIMCQTWRFICLNLKRLCTDFVIFQGYSMEDFQKMIEQSGATEDWRILWDQYKDLISPRSYLRLHIVGGSFEFINIEWKRKTLI